MEPNKPTGIILPFKSVPGKTIISVKTRQTKNLMKACEAVFALKPNPANTNDLGDLAHFRQPHVIQHHIRMNARKYVADVHRDIINHYQYDLGFIQDHLTFAHFTYSLLAELRDCSAAKAIKNPKLSNLHWMLDQAVNTANDIIHDLEGGAA